MNQLLLWESEPENNSAMLLMPPSQAAIKLPAKPIPAKLPRIPCLSLWQPWATLMAIGAKKIETRHWPVPSKYRGLFAIHAAKKVERSLIVEDPFYEHLVGLISSTDALSDDEEIRESYSPEIISVLPRGAIIGVCVLDDCVSTNARKNTPKPTEDDDEYWFGNFERDRYMWATRDMIALPEPIPYKGKQGMWWLESEAVQRICEQITLPT